MLRTDNVDYYYSHQPEKRFTETLREKYIPKIPNGLDVGVKNKKSFLGAFINSVDENFTNLDASLNMFNDFLTANSLVGKLYPINIIKGELETEESYSINVLDNKCIISAGAENGIRRALIRLEDELVSQRGFLPFESINGKMDIERRLTRCYFCPTNRPPLNGDELNDDVDYYPDNFLERLSRNGINGVWIYSDFELLVSSDVFTEYKGSERRIKKLNNVIEKCSRYGISVYIFLIEPIALTHPKKKANYPHMVEKYSDVLGNSVDGEFAMCTYTERAKKYCQEACKKLFELAPNLKGMIHVSDGERITTCSSNWPSQEWEWENNCPHCKDKSRAEILVNTINIFNDSIKTTKPSAEYVSWTYGHRMWQSDEVLEYINKIPSDVVMMQNFEDNGRAIQLGKKRPLYDYWLAYKGPSQMFEMAANRSKENGKKQWAKMQVCCSHDVASVPYVPVPGILYDKFMESKKLGVTGILESWYFGNYPCMMQKAADILSSNKSFSSKKEFLKYLASLYFKKESIDSVVKAWQYFEKGYTMYPYNILFSYYGPMHDGIVWELSLKPKNFSLPRSWFLTDKPDGDRIGESMFNGHKISEIVTLLTKLSKSWDKGCSYLKGVNDNEEQTNIANSLNVLFDSGKNVMEFYALRNDLGYNRGNNKAIINKMRALVKKEIDNCKKMIPYCEVDNRLGYHSEAEGFKFFPEKLENRIKQLEDLLNTEFKEVEQRIISNQAPLEYFNGVEEGVSKCYIANDIESAEWQVLSDGKSLFRIADSKDKILMQFKGEKDTDFLVCNEFELMFPGVSAILKSDGKVKLHRDCMFLQSVVDEKIQIEKDKWNVENLSRGDDTYLNVSLNKKDFGFIRYPYKLMVKTMDGASWCVDPLPVYTLGKSKLSPGDFGWILKK